MLWGTFGLKNSKLDFVKNHMLGDLILFMNEYSWSKELIDDESFYSAFKDFGYSIFNQEEQIVQEGEVTFVVKLKKKK